MARRIANRTVPLLNALERARLSFGADAARTKLDLLTRLGTRRIERPADLLRFHDLLLFVLAYADDRRVRAAALRLLRRFERRPDLARHRDALADSGVAGTEIWFRFFEPTARWLAGRWPERIRIDWDAFENADRLNVFLPALAHPAAAPVLDAEDRAPRAWVDAMRPRRERDAAFLIRRFAQIERDPVLRERLWDELDVPLLVDTRGGGPSRTSALDARASFKPRRTALVRGRPDLRRAILEPARIRAVSTREGQRYIDLARVSMITRARDLDAFSWADPHDVRLADYGDGLVFACMGQIPERRLMFESVYGYLTLCNGVPAGYVLTASLFGSAEVAYNVFETFRGAEAARVYGRVLAMTRQLFGADTFMVPPYQLGDGNDEALASGAWWFYQKLGFRPRDRATQRRMRRELDRMGMNGSHRSSARTLEALAGEPLYWSAGAQRSDVMGRLPLAALGRAALRVLAKRSGDGRGDEAAALAGEAARRAGVRSMRGWTRGERDAWSRWAPVVLALPGLTRWSPAERRALVRVVRLKGGRRESDYVRAFDGHAKLRRALLQLGRTTPA